MAVEVALPSNLRTCHCLLKQGHATKKHFFLPREARFDLKGSCRRSKLRCSPGFLLPTASDLRSDGLNQPHEVNFKNILRR